MVEIPIVSFCIPTYRNAHRVKSLLQCLAEQNLSDVEIIIRDDSPDTETEDCVNAYQDRISVRYFHGEHIGFDRAILFLLEHASGKYVWFFGDDLMMPDTIATVVAKLKNFPDISFLYINGKSAVENSKPVFHYKQDFFFSDNRNVITELNELIAFQSAVVYDREKAFSCIREARSHIGSGFIQLYFVLHVLSLKGAYCFIQEALIITEPKLPEFEQYHDTFHIFAVEIYKIAREFEVQFGRKTIKKMLTDNFHGIWKGIIVYRARGITHDLGSPEITLREIARYYWSYPDFWFALPLLLLPRKVLTVFYSLFRLLFRGEKK